MPGDRIRLASVPDEATAELLREVLNDGGIADVVVRGMPGVAYLPRASSLDWVVTVSDVDEARARLVLADFEAESGQAATSQSSDVVQLRHEHDDDVMPPRRKPWVFWVAAVIALVFLVPFFLNVLTIAYRFLFS